MQEMQFEAGLVAGFSGLNLDQTKRLVETYLPRVGEPLPRQREAAEEAAVLAKRFGRKAELSSSDGNEVHAMYYHRVHLAFQKISYLASREVEIMESRIK
jgi:hypothetical protein